jgi:hypothetical protein
MIGDAKEHVCSGCYEIIAPHDPEAYQEGTFYYHSRAHKDKHVFPNWNASLETEGEHSREVVLERMVRP